MIIWHKTCLYNLELITKQGFNMTDRVSTLSLHNTNLRYMTNSFAELNDLNRQIASGKKYDNYIDLNGKVEQVSNYETQLKRIDSYIDNNSLITTRLNVMNNSLTQLQDIATSFKAEISSSSALNTEANLAENGRAAIEKILDQLNVKLTGRYLFSGSKTDIAPVTNPPVNDIIGVADTDYYNGNSDKLNARVTDNLTLEYGITGDDPAFQNLLAAVNTAISAGETNNQNQLQQAGTLLDQAITNLAQTRAKINSDMIIVADANTQHERTKLVFQDSLSQEVSTDIAEATIQLSANETILQATFSSFSRLSALRLVDFLN